MLCAGCSSQNVVFTHTFNLLFLSCSLVSCNGSFSFTSSILRVEVSFLPRTEACRSQVYSLYLLPFSEISSFKHVLQAIYWKVSEFTKVLGAGCHKPERISKHVSSVGFATCKQVSSCFKIVYLCLFFCIDQ